MTRAFWLTAEQSEERGEGITAEQMKEIQRVIPRVIAQASFTEWTSGGKDPRW